MIRMIGQWNINAWILGRCFEDYEDEDWWQRPLGANPAVWILGHILATRRYLARTLGLEVETADWEEHFGIGTDPDALPRDTDGAGLLREFEKTHDRFVGHLEGLEASALDEEVEDEFPGSSKTRLGALQFLFLHEAYHIGQLGQNRTQLGKGTWMPA